MRWEPRKPANLENYGIQGDAQRPWELVQRLCSPSFIGADLKAYTDGSREASGWGMPARPKIMNNEK
ncbi:MAG: hypothetical protein CVU04_04615 [Bacteroidetes bacterium HGW-Bacteroidetes-20]|nr:MAG: hypothetical protein CVU04_04615 [Bacteroidetes bacterium HGW-Bacteroidetes-20]